MSHQISGTSTIGFVPLATRRDGDGWVVGRAGVGPFVNIPDVGYQAIDRLRAGVTVETAAADLGQRHGAAVDVLSFALTLAEVGLVDRIDGREVPVPDPPRTSLGWIRPAWVRWLFGPVGLALWVGLLAAAVVAMAVDSSILPSYDSIVWVPSVALALAGTAAIEWLLIGLHEVAHLSAGRARGLPGRISLSTRLCYLVAQTDLTGAWALPRRHRVPIYLAGMAVDVAVAASALLAVAVLDLSGSLRLLCQAIALLRVLSVVHQFGFYIRSDVYFLVQDLTGCQNLMADARRTLRYWWHRMASRTPDRGDPTRDLPARERRAVRGYTPFLLVGSAVELAVFAVVSIPLVVVVLAAAIGNVVMGQRQGSPALVLDGIAALATVGTVQTILVVLLVRRHGPRFARVVRALASRVQSGRSRRSGSGRLAGRPSPDDSPRSRRRTHGAT